ncbi:MAG TPA: GH32 C-terminal domain-containing protein, partial [Clostridia bacterium]|nr:GH32 C-terminal domain-containing protein [Clostridia bacterium]
CFYASQTYNDIPERDGRRILVPWGQMATPGMPFNQMMGIPVELTLRKTEEGLRLFTNPVRELEKLRAKCVGFKSETLHADRNPFSAVTGELLDIEVELSPGSAEELTFLLRGVPVVYDVSHQELRCQDRKAVLKPINGKIRLRFLVDRTSIDIFGNNGQLYMPMGVLVPSHNFSVVLSMKGQGARLEAAKAFILKSAWR